MRVELSAEGSSVLVGWRVSTSDALHFYMVTLGLHLQYCSGFNTDLHLALTARRSPGTLESLHLLR